MRYLFLLLLLPAIGLADPSPDCKGDPHHCTGDPAVDILNNNIDTDLDLDLDNDIDLRSSMEIDNGDVNLSSKDSSRYFAFGTSFPNAEGCLGGVQLGFGLYGQHRINTSCWSQKLVDSEKGLETRARLKCGDKIFRNSIAYEISSFKRKARRQYCIDYIKKDWQNQMLLEREVLAKCQKASCTYVNGVLRLEYYDE